MEVRTRLGKVKYDEGLQACNEYLVDVYLGLIVHEFGILRCSTLP